MAIESATHHEKCYALSIIRGDRFKCFANIRIPNDVCSTVDGSIVEMELCVTFRQEKWKHIFSSEINKSKIEMKMETHRLRIQESLPHALI